ncbi:hypothetical protein Gasu2_56540 [Galdieria sulphuraria]|uniref:Uncharacterized protein n=1 Tax=Galdieria sulphuraria TaxID=130081 RepID=M2VT59_GALSU|nr:uncharacterized protein Gasu_60160 [Galdieria sulphuraria]EME26341.1 hypothetical protein Gasu_60160 [Galdieria sulphuraria]GJD11520.1 hypothetical protein Gasu2_56540 [Galdieria sulphuraria]|eukprot:XP_005702861.1 hypothetical protein Gasu_60160 [Galdieria sulphuraria]
MFSSTSCRNISSTDIESEEALEAARECLSSFSLQVLLALKFHKSPEEIQRELWNTMALYLFMTRTPDTNYEEQEDEIRRPFTSYHLTDSLSGVEGGSIYSETSQYRSTTEGQSDEDRANAASHLFNVLKSLQFRKFPSERVVAKVRKISD